MKTCLYILAFFLFFGMVPEAEAVRSIEFTGYYKNFNVLLDPVEYRGASQMPRQDLTGFINNRLRLNVDIEFAERLFFLAAYDFSPRIQDRSFSEDFHSSVTMNPSVYRVFDLSSPLYPQKIKDVKSFALYQNLDRAVVTFTTDAADFYLGRQAIAWGSARSINPTDVIAPFTFDELDAEDRFGVDALRVRIPIGPLGEFDGGYIFGDDFEFEKSAFYMRNKLYAARTDVSAILLAFRQNLLVGFDIARAVGGAGVWLEAAHVFVDLLDKEREGSSKDYFRGTAGCDYSFSGKLYGFLEYHLSHAGTGEPEGYLERLNHPAYEEGAVYLLGRHYVVPGLTLLLTPLFNLEAQALINVTDPSVLLAPIVEYNIRENIYVAAGAFAGFGRRPHISTDSTALPVLLFRSEFGGYPDIYFASLRYYF